MKFVLPRAVSRVAAFAVTAILAGTVTARAASTDSFDVLRAELAFRVNVLTGSVDKVEQKQGKTCLKVIATIDKSTTLSGDIKALGKVAKTLLKAFPNDFLLEATTTELLAVTDLSDLLEGSLSNLVAEIQSELDEIQLEINALPDGSDKTAAQTALDTAQDLLNQTGTSPDFAIAAKLLSSTLKSLLSAAKSIDKANNSGGGGGGGQGLNCKINGSSFSAIGAGGTYSNPNTTKQFTITGATAQKAVTIIAFGVTGAGSYPAGGGTGFQDITGGINYASNMTGTIYIATFNLAQQKASGTFTFTATQSTPVPNPTNGVEVLEGSFNISTIFQTPVFP